MSMNHLQAIEKKLFGQINKFKQDNNYKFLWTANGKIHLRATETSNTEAFNAIDWNVLINSDSNINDLTNSVIRAINIVIEKHAPIRMASRNKQKQLRKPWITNAILKSVKNKQSMYKTHFFLNRSR